MTPAIAGMRVALEAAALLGMLGVLAVARRLGLGAEWSRKLAHVGLGGAALAWPLLFDAAWPAAVVAALTVIVLVALRVVPMAARAAGGAVCGVSRRTTGDLWFPVAAASLFALTGGHALTYAVPVATLALADAAAALVGRRWGRHRFHVGAARKSVEGSLAFAGVAFVIALGGLSLAPDGALGVSRDATLALGAALAYAAATTVAEAVSTHGLDNVTVPFAGATAMTLLVADPAAATVLLSASAAAVAALAITPRTEARAR
ncbi:MAG: hypothetical protein HY275_04085 [Gemmatimonadetes bacterium]|nr:hypothetical protein [Gemmatimonadota bacterium]